MTTSDLPPPFPLAPLVPPAGFELPAQDPRAYRPARRLATVLSWLLVGCVAAGAAGVATTAFSYQEIGRTLDAPGVIGRRQMDAADQRLLVTYAVILTFLLTAFGFLIAWTRRLYRNLVPLGTTGLRYTPGWAVGGWFVPFLNLARPKQILNDIWRAGAPPEEQRWTWHTNEVSPLLHWWWGLWIATGALGWAGPPGRSDVQGYHDALTSEILWMSALTAMATLGVLLVRKLTARQEQHAARSFGPGTAAGVVDGRSGCAVATWALAPAGVIGFAAALVVALLTGTASRAATGAAGTAGRDHRDVLAFELEAGDCFDDPDDLREADPGDTVDVLAVEVLPCSEPHHNEAFALVDHDAGDGEDYPGEADMATFAVLTCIDELEVMAGRALDGSGLDVGVVFPSSVQWEDGDRTVICFAYSIDGEKLTGSVRSR